MSLLIDSKKVSAQSSLPDKKNFHLFILAGQSNMAGRGEIEHQYQTAPNRVLKLNENGEWVPAKEPIHFDKSVAGVGPGQSFGISVAHRDSSITVGLIPCAAGGSSIIHWEPDIYFDQTDSYPYDDCLERVQKAQKDGTLQAILWHQGEADAISERAPKYEERLHRFIKRFRADINRPELPFIAGQLGKFDSYPWNKWKVMVNKTHQQLPNQISKTAFITSDGLSDKGDSVHFDTASARDLGKRYADAYLTLIKEMNSND